MTDQKITKDKCLNAVLDHVMFDGWSEEAVRRGAADLGMDVLDFDLLFPGGLKDLVTFYVTRADDRMEAALQAKDVLSMKIRDRITLAVRTRLELVEQEKDCVRKTLTWLAMPQNAALALKLTNETVSRMWYATGDRSTDFSYYTKRLTLSAVYSATLLYWLDDVSEGHEKTWGFLDRRIENVMQFETFKFKTRQKLANKPDFSFIPRPGRFFRNLTAK
ncbi:COQ9 family protein [Sneathiella sp.]|jgi:ubiquinone biosynthesis protein COQ9|uniref:COQ9 family protein n=1 Tax=Sneathiella sp. TaxID=1964365 RepID=UPI0039E3B345